MFVKLASILAALVGGAALLKSFDRGPSFELTGQEVYIAEGCIHCHSQFSRPGTLDTDIYGPVSHPDGGNGQAVLIGNRRQGPDLSSIGLRRSREWNRLHLIEPQVLSPGSRMPSYAHLFEDGGLRGEALLDYLASLGIESVQDWFVHVQAWNPDVSEGSAGRGEELFETLCVQCHGFGGEGNGVLADRLSPSNFLAGGFRFAPISLDGGMRRVRLARIVKYGIPGVSMPGHEYLTDEDIVDLVAFVSGFSVREGQVK